MQDTAADKPVPQETAALLSGERLILRETKRAVTPFGGVAVFVSFLRKIDLIGQLRRYRPVEWKSPNRIDPTDTFLAFLMTVLLRGDQALHAPLGMKRFPIDDTIRNLFRQFGMEHGMADATFAATA